MEQHMRETIDECLIKIRDTRKDDTIHHGENMHLTGYASALMHARVIDPVEWEEICNLREDAHQYWKENKK